MKGKIRNSIKSFDFDLQIWNFRVQYQFEDEPFDTVPDLITFYVGEIRFILSVNQKFKFLFSWLPGSGKAISAASGDILPKAFVQHVH